MQSGCCKPPTSCNYNMATTVNQDPDCYRWNNAPNLLCYECDSCKAGVLEDVKRDWHKLSVLNIVMLVVLIGIYSIGCCAFRNTQRAETDHPYGQNRMSKVRPRWDYYWWVTCSLVKCYLVKLWIWVVDHIYFGFRVIVLLHLTYMLLILKIINKECEKLCNKSKRAFSWPIKKK